MEIKTLELTKDITCVASIDADLRVFDIIMTTEFGTTYNSYIVKGTEKTAIFETTKTPFWDMYVDELKRNVDLEKVDYIICDHTEPDHAGSVTWMVENCPNATVVGSAAAIMFLEQMTNKSFKSKKVTTGDSIDLGGKTLNFIFSPFLHWPDSMFTYIPGDKTLITCDFLGCHFADNRMLLSKVEDRIKEYNQAFGYYYKVIFGPFKKYVIDGLNAIKDLDLDRVLVGHGPVLDTNIKQTIEKYEKLAGRVEEKPKDKYNVFMGYVSAYGFTSQIGDKIKDILESTGKIEVEKLDISENDHGKIDRLISNADGILMGSCTINADAVKPVYDVLSHVSVPVNKDKPAAAFGSFGWSGEGPVNLEHRLEDLQFKIASPALRINFLPSKDEDEMIEKFAKDFIAALTAELKQEYKHISKTKWRCIVCGEVYEGELPPEICPACGVGADKFEEVVEQEITYSCSTPGNFVIVGGGIAGLSAAESIRVRNKTCEINIFTDEKYYPYYRTKLSEYISEDIEEKDFLVKPKEWYDENNIKVHTMSKVVSVNPGKKTISLISGKDVAYNKLILANGASSFIPPVQGIDKQGLFVLRDIDDLKSIKEYLSDVEKVCVIGGGLLGLEAAWNISKLDKQVSIIELAKRILPVQLNEEGSFVFERIIDKRGIDIVKGKMAKKILGNGKVTGLEFDDGSKIDADMIIYAIGIRANRELVEGCGFELNRGMVVNSKMETCMDDVWACGDVCEFGGRVYGNWDSAKNQGKVAGANACGDDVEFIPPFRAYVLNSMGTEVFSSGEIGIDKYDYKAYLNKDFESNSYKKALFRNNRMCGTMLIGDTKESLKYLKGIKEGISPKDFLKLDII